MPIFEDTAAAPTKPKPDTIRAWKPSLQTAVIDTRYIPQSNLLAYIEGSTWVVDYYSQVLDVNNELQGQDISLPAVAQSYRRIWSMELKVTQDLQQVSQDPSTNEQTLMGSANVYPFLVPQEGDMFRVGIADGREGLFKVTKVEARQIFTDTAHVIEYQLIAANDPARIYDIEKKTILTYFFVKDFLLNLQNPLLLEADYHAMKKLECFYHDMLYLYFRQYFSREYMTLVVPAQQFATYDHGLTDFVKQIMDSSDDVHIQSIRQLNIGDDRAISALNLWGMLSRRDPKLMPYVYQKAGLVSRTSFHSSGLMAGMRYTGIARIVYPSSPSTDVDYELAKQVEKPLLAETIISKMPPLPVPPPGPDGLTPLPLIKPIDFTNGYVMSEAFWKRNMQECSLLEKLVLDYLDFKLIDASHVLKLCESSFTWGPVEKFYYFPLLTMLIRYIMRRL